MLARILLVCFAMLALSSGASAAELLAVIHPLNPTTGLTAREIRKLYLGTTRRWGKGEVEVVLFIRPDESPAADALMTACKTTRQRFDALWTRKQLAGQAVTPRVLVEPADVLATVAADPRAISVVTRDEVDALDTSTVKLLPIQ